MIQILLYANVLAFKGRVRDGEGEGSSGNKAPGFESSALPYSIFSLKKLYQHSQLEKVIRLSIHSWCNTHSKMIGVRIFH